MTLQRGASEKRVTVDQKTGREIWQMTCSSVPSLHSYYDLCPWSCDGRSMVFCSLNEERTKASICVMDAVSGEFRKVGETDFVNTHEGAYQQWLGSSNRIAYLHVDSEGSSIAVVDADTGEVEKYPGAIRMISPDGRQVLSHSDKSETDSGNRDSRGIFLSDLTGGEPRLLVSLNQALEAHPRRGEIDDYAFYFKHPKWSPDGSRLLFVLTDEHGVNGRFVNAKVKDIFTVKPDGSDLRHACDFKLGNHPAWHPDSKRILLNNRDGFKQSFYLQLTDCLTGEREVIPHFPGGGHPSISPDGTHLLIEIVTGIMEGIGQIYCVNLTNGEVELLVEVPVRNHQPNAYQGTHLHPVWSRDGNYVLINSDRSGHSELCVIPLGW